MDILELKVSLVGNSETLCASFVEQYVLLGQYRLRIRWREHANDGGTSGSIAIDGGLCPLRILTMTSFAKPELWYSDAVILLYDPSNMVSWQALTKGYTACTNANAQPPVYLVGHRLGEETKVVCIQ